MSDKKVLTLQDISCMGQCSLTVALPIISACGVETIILPSAVLSTHTGGFKGYTFRDLTDDIPLIMNHWMSEGIKFDCLYTGYLGNIRQIDYVHDLRKNLMKDNALFIADPAMADFGNLYAGFDRKFVKSMAQLCGYADIILPNITEAAFMTDSEVMLDNHSEEYIDMLLSKLASLGCKAIILKGICYNDKEIGIVYYDCLTNKKEHYFTEKINTTAHGTGDCYAAAFTGSLIKGFTPFDAARLAADFVVECIKHTVNDKEHWYGVKFEQALPMLVSKLNK